MVALCLLLVLGTQTPELEGPLPNVVQSDPEAVKAIARYLDARGGREALGRLRDKVLHFDSKKYQPTGTTIIKMVRVQKKGYKLREEWELPMGISVDGSPLKFLQVYDGDRAWVRAMGAVAGLEGKTLIVFMWDKPLSDKFMHWEDDGYTARFLGESSVDGAPVVGVELVPFAGSERVRYYFSRDDGLLLKKAWAEAAGNGLIQREVLFADYVAVPLQDDRATRIKIPTNEKVFEDGELSLEKVFTEIHFNGGVDDAVFGRPEGPDLEEVRRDPGARSRPRTQPDPTRK